MEVKEHAYAHRWRFLLPPGVLFSTWKRLMRIILAFVQGLKVLFYGSFVAVVVEIIITTTVVEVVITIVTTAIHVVVSRVV